MKSSNVILSLDDFNIITSKLNYKEFKDISGVMDLFGKLNIETNFDSLVLEKIISHEEIIKLIKFFLKENKIKNQIIIFRFRGEYNNAWHVYFTNINIINLKLMIKYLKLGIFI